MKSVIVYVGIQIDIPNQDEDRVSEVTRVLSVMNEIIGISELESDPQILMNDIGNSDIVDVEEEFEIDDEVVVPDPDYTNYDYPPHGFVGIIKDIRGDYAEVEDQEGDVFTVELVRLTRK